MILTHDKARQILNVGDGRITGTVIDNENRYYVIDNLLEQRTEHVPFGDPFFDEYVGFSNLSE
jgi:hypothetical protein